MQPLHPTTLVISQQSQRYGCPCAIKPPKGQVLAELRPSSCSASHKFGFSTQLTTQVIPVPAQLEFGVLLSSPQLFITSSSLPIPVRNSHPTSGPSRKQHLASSPQDPFLDSTSDKLPSEPVEWPRPQGPPRPARSSMSGKTCCATRRTRACRGSCKSTGGRVWASLWTVFALLSRESSELILPAKRNPFSQTPDDARIGHVGRWAHNCSFPSFTVRTVSRISVQLRACTDNTAPTSPTRA